MATVTLTPTACTVAAGFTDLSYYGNSSGTRQLIFTIPNNSQLATHGVEITAITIHGYVRNSSTSPKQLQWGFKASTSSAPSAWASYGDTLVRESKFTAINGVKSGTSTTAIAKTYGTGSVLIGYLEQEMQAGNPVYLGVVQPQSGYSIRVDPTLTRWTIDVTYEIRGNIPTLDSDSYSINKATVTVNVERVLEESTTTLNFKMGDTTVSTANIGTATSYTYTTATSLGDYFPSTTTGTLTVEAVTYVDGTEYGTVTTSATLTLPDNTNPTIIIEDDSVIWAEDVPTASRIDLGTNYIQTKTGINVPIWGIGTYGSKIVNIALTIDNTNYTQDFEGTTTAESVLFAHTAFISSGSVAWKATVTDTRGFTNSWSGALNVLPWSAPKIQSFTVNRATSEGVEAIDGTYALSALKSSVSSLKINGTEKNKMSFIVYARDLESESTSWTIECDKITGTSVSGSFSGLLSWDGEPISTFNDMSGYEFKVVVSDLFGSSTAYDSMPTKVVHIDIDESTGYIGFGGDSPAEDEGIGYRFYSPIDIPSGSFIQRYSTEPVPVGTWIDGRTIYRQVFDLGDISVAKGTVTTVLVSGTPTYDVLVDLRAFGRWGTGDNWCVIPRIWTTTTGTLSIDYASSLIRLRSINTGAFTLSDVYVYVEFVLKEEATTLALDDEASPINDPDDVDAIADLQAQVATLKAQIAALTKEGESNGD